MTAHQTRDNPKTENWQTWLTSLLVHHLQRDGFGILYVALILLALSLWQGWLPGIGLGLFWVGNIAVHWLKIRHATRS